MNISEIEEIPDYKQGNNGNGNNNPFNYPTPRDIQILRTSCLKCATFIVSDFPLEMDKKVDLALDVAKRLERYLTIVPVPDEESLLVASVQQRGMDEEF